MEEIFASIEVGLIYSIVAIGIYLTFRIIDFPDLTCDGSFMSGAAVSGSLIANGVSVMLATICAFIVGVVIGVVTGVLHIYCRVQNLLAGILVAFMLYSINMRIMGGISNISLVGYKTIFSDISPILVLSCILAFILCIFSYVLSTDFGLAARAIGRNKSVCKTVGICISGITLAMLGLSNGAIALSGSLMAQYQQLCDTSQGVGTLVVGFAGIFLGEQIFKGRFIIFSILSCIAGSVLYRVIIAFALHADLLHMEVYDVNLITGIIVTIVIYLTKIRISDDKNK
ncbi:ABC transporter permease [Candidatus Fokinia crypta]|uniref:ABC transporter permease component n=1 Tax=Candidatus Fokinia crypta TaxID=1920990 RepID=A0ABZ0UQP3_9RICK|nr:hypothetical protein [Candidatus Fokinia cryptica]WPX97546.1 ABC transporter permease component [Candidatus Fokinia cryptica]